MSIPVAGQERQLTFSPMGHDLDNNDNFSPDGNWLCFDTRETVEFGIHNSQSVMMVNIETGEEVVLLAAEQSAIGKEAAAPGIGAVSFNHARAEVAFIHGPPLDQVPARGPYDFPNRTGARIFIDEPRKRHWLDHRDIATDRETLPGALRGGTHRHEYTWNGNRIGFTYNDFLMQDYDRTVGYMEPHPNAPGDASHYAVLMVPTVPIGTAKPGEIEKAWGDSWVGREGRMRAFIGHVRAVDGEAYEQSLFVADLPLSVDIASADSGSATRYPTPPKDITIRRLTKDWANGIVRGSHDGEWIAYYGKAADASTQVFIVRADGSEPPRQVTTLPFGAGAGLRWHASGNSVLCFSNNGVVSTSVQEGVNFGKSIFLTNQEISPERSKLALSWDGSMIAFNKPVPTADERGGISKNYLGEDHIQIFVLPFPDSDGDGIAD
ncbi:MAG: DUF3748 domain-containing protein [Candidatus Hydrogenedentota bacterium]